MNFGERLSELRKEQEWTQEELAKKLRVSRSAVSMYEKRGRRPNYDLLNDIAALFDVSVSYLTGSSDVRGHSRPVVTPEDERMAALSALLSPDEFSLLTAYQSSSTEIREAVRAVLGVR